MDTVQEALLALADSDTPALLADDRRWSWREYVGDAARRANAVGSLLDPQRPAHVGVLMENTAEMALALAAGALGGYVTAGINRTRRGPGLVADVHRADCQVLLTDSGQRGLLEGLDVGIPVLETDGEEWAALVAAHSPEPPGVAPSETFMLIFTSGTSGPPKAVRVGNAMTMLSGANLVGRFGLGPEDVCYVSMPLFHSNAIMAGYAVAITAGAAMALAPRFSASRLLEDVRRYGATYLNYVGKPLAYVLRTPAKPDDADNPLRVAFGNEASEKDIAAFAERFGCAVVDGFGSTETAVIVTRAEGNTPPGSIGTPWPGVEVYSRATGAECPRAEFDASGRVVNLDEAVGELVNTTGAGFFGGYYNDPEATAERMAGGMYWSGDLAYRDADGYVYLAGRTTDWLRVDGENLAAGMVEAILLRHPAISQVAVYGVPDPDAGDQLVAAIVPTGAGLTPSGFESFLDAQADLSPKARPRYVRLCDALPSTATNKVLKRDLISQGLTGDLWERDERGTAYRERVP